MFSIFQNDYQALSSITLQNVPVLFRTYTLYILRLCCRIVFHFGYVSCTCIVSRFILLIYVLVFVCRFSLLASKITSFLLGNDLIFVSTRLSAVKALKELRSVAFKGKLSPRNLRDRISSSRVTNVSRRSNF